VGSRHRGDDRGLAFLAVCQSHQQAHYGTPPRLGPGDSRRGSCFIGADAPCTRDRGHAAGAPPRFECSRCGADQPAGRRRARSHHVLHRADGGRCRPHGVPAGHPPLYLHDGVVYRGPPALDGIRPPAIVPERRSSRRRAADARAFGTQLPAEIEARFVTGPLRPRIECGSRRCSRGRMLRLELLAVSDDPATQQIGRPTVATDESVKRPGARDDKIYSWDTTPAQIAVPHLENCASPTTSATEAGWTAHARVCGGNSGVARGAAGEIEVVDEGELGSCSARRSATVDFELIESAATATGRPRAGVETGGLTLTPEEIALLPKARGRLVRLPGKGWRRLHLAIDDAPPGRWPRRDSTRRKIGEAALAGERIGSTRCSCAQSPLTELRRSAGRDAARARPRHRAAGGTAGPAGCRVLRPFRKTDSISSPFFLRTARGVLATTWDSARPCSPCLAALVAHGKRRRVARAMVVCPKSVIGTWGRKREVRAVAATIRFKPALRDARSSRARRARVLGKYTRSDRGRLFHGAALGRRDLDEGRYQDADVEGRAGGARAAGRASVVSRARRSRTGARPVTCSRSRCPGCLARRRRSSATTPDDNPWRSRGGSRVRISCYAARRGSAADLRPPGGRARRAGGEQEKLYRPS